MTAEWLRSLHSVREKDWRASMPEEGRERDISYILGGRESTGQERYLQHPGPVEDRQVGMPQPPHTAGNSTMPGEYGYPTHAKPVPWY